MSFSNVPLDSWLLHPGREFEQSKLNNVSYGSQIKDYYAWWIEYDLSGLAENNSYSFRVQLHEEDGDLIQITPIETFQVASNSENYYYSVYELYGNFETNSNNVYLKVFEGDWESGDTTKDSGNLVGVSDVIVFDEYGWVPSDYVSSVETLGLELNNYYYESSSSSDGTNQFFAVLGSQIPGSMYGLSTSPIYGNSVYFFDQEDDSFTLPHQEIYLINNSTYLNSFGSTKTLEVSSDGINWVTDNRNWGNDTIWRSSYRYTVSGTDHSINIFTWDIGKYFRVKYNYFDEAGFPMEVTSDPLQILTSPYSYNYTNIGSAGFSLSGNAEVDKTLTVNQIKNDPDGVDNNNLNYKWQSSVDKSSWTDINWVESYLPIISDDEGMYIRSIISYTDSKNNS